MGAILLGKERFWGETTRVWGETTRVKNEKRRNDKGETTRGGMSLGRSALLPSQAHCNLVNRVNVGTFGRCRYNRTLLYFLDNFRATSVVIAKGNPDKSQ